MHGQCKMKIPGGEFAFVDLAKLRDYCLNPSHSEGKHKARVFASVLGLSAVDSDFLRDELLYAARVLEAEIRDTDKYGDRYVLDFPITKGNRTATVRSAWIIRLGQRFRNRKSEWGGKA